VQNIIIKAACAALLSTIPAGYAGAQTAPAAPVSAQLASTSTLTSYQLPSDLVIPASGRFLLVDAVSAQLFMIEDGRVQDTMRVIVGKPTAATPVIKSTIYSATLNPYWHVPTDLARSLIAPRVLKGGNAYLTDRGYEVVSDFSAGATVLTAASVDWEAVADGRLTVHVRQLPGAANSMGRVKFAFANEGGIYLHDTPRKELFDAADRSLSAGCVRVEDAGRLATWLLGGTAAASPTSAEQDLPLPTPVPIVIMYMNVGERVQLAAL
jgi:murein L,D-transpeptidase YcbB/YkuD